MNQSFKQFITETGDSGPAYIEMVKKHANASSLDQKTAELAYISVLSAVRIHDGLAFHVQSAKKLGATREEIISAVLVGLPAVGLTVVASLEETLRSYDEA
ncbi:carboxymuconolactone decarboxylase family protein [Vagococcus entomophilus]|uniref:Carboxymuconolactone decarboxylase n=1 Tax=Vagococcus entomophilus TaxID=1160095 RepID=A0A430AHT6_9ENTE|nr:carboxymuconolactone decarboxylase family protein [Vagococcus entomophilus]RSU07669.1 carboxymuconolactone decarboxylase [Vagococcus entomophilus]